MLAPPFPFSIIRSVRMMIPKVDIARIHFPEGKAHDRPEVADYNVCNLWEENTRPQDYDVILSATNTKNWVHAFHGDIVETLTIDDRESLRWMKQANEENYLGHFSHMWDDELADTTAKYQHAMPQLVPTEGWFIRTEHVSLKTGMYGAGPYHSLENILKSIVTSSGRHQALRPDDSQCVIYFLQWRQIEPDREMRCFVYQDRLTAISAQTWFRPAKWLAGLSDAELTSLTHNIRRFFQDTICPRLLYLSGHYTFDLAILSDGFPYFIEPNPFGARYSAGSSLFHWIKDAHLLENWETIQLRFVVQVTETL